jgi:hypothetical protein
VRDQRAIAASIRRAGVQIAIALKAIVAASSGTKPTLSMSAFWSLAPTLTVDGTLTAPRRFYMPRDGYILGGGIIGWNLVAVLLAYFIWRKLR